LEEGYGLSTGAIETISKTGTKVIITVDCGVNAFEEAEFAREKGIDLIITDHHEPCGELPEAGRAGGHGGCNCAFGLINPKLATSNYPFRELSGVGVAFMLAWALGQNAPNRNSQSAGSGNKKVAPAFKDFLMSAMGLAALGTIADVVPLEQENRILAKYGLSSLQHSENPGIKALKEVAGLNGKKIYSYHVGFCLGPRINAAGRMGNAKKGVEMLTAKCEDTAKEIALYLESENKKRQKIQSNMLESAKKKVRNDVDFNSDMAIIISDIIDENWHQGVIGVVASRLVAKHHRPVIIIAIDGEVGHGSARSIPGFHLHNALLKCQELSTDRKLLISFGGHAQAAGLRVLEKDIPEFKKIFNTVSKGQLGEEDLIPALNIDIEVELSSISISLLDELKCLLPYGEGNPAPIFATRDISIVGRVRRFGVNGKHLGFYVRQGDVSFKAVAFGMGDKIEFLEQNGGNCSIAYALRSPYRKEADNLSDYNGMYKEDVELDIKDIST
jgi:single-stranded-DNA-specific exonuclease